MDFETFRRIAENTEPERGVFAKFYDRSVKTEDVNKNGLPVFKRVTFVEIRLRDNNTEVYDQPATPENIRRFPVEYARYQLGKKQVEDGTPLEQFAFLAIDEIETMKYHGLFTVEALAQLDDEKAKDLNCIRERDLACRFLENAKGNSALAEFEKKEAAYKAEIAKLKEEIAALKTSKKEK